MSVHTPFPTLDFVLQLCGKTEKVRETREKRRGGESVEKRSFRECRFLAGAPISIDSISEESGSSGGVAKRDPATAAGRH